MQAKVRTVAFQGIDVLPVDVQVQMAPGLPAFAIVGLADKAVGESRERVRAALARAGPGAAAAAHHRQPLAGRPAKEGSHFDLPIALGAAGRHGRAAARTSVAGYVALGELALDGALAPCRRRAAGGDRRPRGRARPDLPGGLRRRGRLGWRGRGADHRRAVAARPDQPSARPRSCSPPPAGADRRGPRGYPDLADVKGQETRQARAGDRRGRRPQPADGRPARLRQVDAGGAPARHPAAAGSPPRRWRPR